MIYIILLTKTTAAQNEVAHSYHNVLGLYFLALVFAATIILKFSLFFVAAVNATSIGAKSSFSWPAVVKVVNQLELFIDLQLRS